MLEITLHVDVIIMNIYFLNNIASTFHKADRIQDTQKIRQKQ